MKEPTTDLDTLWDALWDELRHYATGKPSGDAIIRSHRAAIEAGAVASSRLVSAVRDWIQFGAGDGTDEAEHTSQHLLERIVAEYTRLDPA